MVASKVKPKTRKPYNRKYDHKRVVALANANIPATLIAKDQDVAISTITRYLEKVGIEYKKIHIYNKNKANAGLFVKPPDFKESFIIN
jgi:DNA invertase Pin-like site-specific DNA recombinase